MRQFPEFSFYLFMAKKASTSDRLRSKLAESLDAANQWSSQASNASTPPPSTPSMSATAAESINLEPAGSRKATVDRIINTSTALAAGAGALPIPVWDTVMIGGIQLKMIADISQAYGVPFTENIGKTAVASLIGALAPDLLARGTFGVFFKTLPGIGSLISTVAMPVLAGGCTYAIGQVFVRHYESGGTLLTFNAKDFQAGFTDEVKAGMKKVAAVKI